MRISGKPWILVIAIMALAAMMVILQMDTREHKNVEGERSAPGDSLETPRLDAMEARLSRIEQLLASKSMHSASERARAHQPPREAEATTTTPDIRKYRTRAAYESQFANERVDPRWAAQTETHLLDKTQTEHMLSIRADMPEERQIDCRSNMCRIQFLFSDQADAQDWSEAYLTGMGNSLARLWYTTERTQDGRTEILIYGFRSP